MITQTYHHYHCMELTEAIKIKVVIMIWPNIIYFFPCISETECIHIMFYSLGTSDCRILS